MKHKLINPMMEFKLIMHSVHVHAVFHPIALKDMNAFIQDVTDSAERDQDTLNEEINNAKKIDFIYLCILNNSIEQVVRK